MDDAPSFLELIAIAQICHMRYPYVRGWRLIIGGYSKDCGQVGCAYWRQDPVTGRRHGPRGNCIVCRELLLLLPGVHADAHPFCFVFDTRRAASTELALQGIDECFRTPFEDGPKKRQLLGRELQRFRLCV